MEDSHRTFRQLRGHLKDKWLVWCMSHYSCIMLLFYGIDASSQKRLLYVFDPTALQSILIKDQRCYEEAAFTIS